MGFVGIASGKRHQQRQFSFVVKFLHRGEYKHTNVAVLFWNDALMTLVVAVRVVAAVIATLARLKEA